MIKCFLCSISLLLCQFIKAQVNWTDVTTQYGQLPKGIQVLKTTDSINGKPTIAFIAKVDMYNHSIVADVDTSRGRRLTPTAFYEKNTKPLLVVNCSFFDFASNRNLNVIMRKKKILAPNLPFISGKGKDTLLYHHPMGSAIGINKKGSVDVAWVYTTNKKAYAIQQPVRSVKDTSKYVSRFYLQQKWKQFDTAHGNLKLKKWNMQLAVGGGPVLVQDGKMAISNNEEMKFAGKALFDTHPRTAMGYTKNGELIILVVQGRFPGIAEGVTLKEEAQLFIDLGCVEAINLDGGGSSCMLINGIETIKPSDKTGQRPVPAVFIVR